MSSTRDGRVPFHVPRAPHLPDHRIGGRAVVPAVDWLAWMARAVRAHVPSCDVTCMREAEFPHPFPVFETSGSDPSAPVEMPDLFLRWAGTSTDPTAIGREGIGAVRATIESRQRLARGMARTIEHASVLFGAADELAGGVPPELAGADPVFEVDAERVYQDLIPFGPSFRNLHGTLRLSSCGAWGAVRAGEASADGCLGSPFLFDAAMHLACVWGQRYAGCVAYPTGFAARRVKRPVCTGELACVVAPRNGPAHALLFDLWLLDANRRVCDFARALRMVPHRGAAVPPGWIRSS